MLTVPLNTRRSCQLLQLLLEELEISSVALHSARSQNRRLAALDRFKSGAVPVLVATDVASRGLDIPTVDLVINYDIPRSGAWLHAVCSCVCLYDIFDTYVRVVDPVIKYDISR
jgi:superfamily II DNA/RNA helicase